MVMIKKSIKLAIILLIEHSCGNIKESDLESGIPPMSNYNRWLCYYNSKGRLSKNVFINVKSGKEEKVDTVFYFYDSAGNLKKSINVSKNFDNTLDSIFRLYEYNKDNKRTKTTVILSYGDTLQVETSSYYKYNNLEGEKYTRLFNKSLSPYKEVTEYDTTVKWFEELFEDSLVKRRDVYGIENNRKTKESSLYYYYNKDKKLTNRYTINVKGDTIGRKIIEYENGKEKRMVTIYPDQTSIMLYDTNGCIDLDIKIHKSKIDTSFYICDKDCKVQEVRTRKN